MTNIAVIVGNLTRDPEMRYSQTGKALTEWTVAVNDGYGDKKTVQFIRCVAFEKLAESIAERARKGSQVVVEGRLVTDSWKDKETGKRREQTKIIARTCQVVVHRSANPPADETDEDVSDIPF